MILKEDQLIFQTMSAGDVMIVQMQLKTYNNLNFVVTDKQISLDLMLNYISSRETDTPNSDNVLGELMRLTESDELRKLCLELKE